MLNAGVKFNTFGNKLRTRKIFEHSTGGSLAALRGTWHGLAASEMRRYPSQLNPVNTLRLHCNRYNTK